MSTINAASSSMRSAQYARSGSGANAEVFVEKGSGSGAGGRGPSATVDLSDRAKALLSKAEQGRTLAGQLAAHMQAGGGGSSATALALMAGGDGKTMAGTAGQASDGIAAVREWAKSDVFRSAAGGVADDRVRAMVRDGQLPRLPQLDEGQRDRMSAEEQNIYGTVSALQGLYDSMPKSLDQALADHKKTVIEAYPDEISRMRSGLASGSLKAEDGWNDIIASREAELAAAMQGTMRIQGVNDPGLIQTKNEFTVARDANGWSARGMTVNGNIPALQESFGTKNLRAESSPYTGDYVITW